MPEIKVADVFNILVVISPRSIKKGEALEHTCLLALRKEKQNHRAGGPLLNFAFEGGHGTWHPESKCSDCAFFIF